MIILSFDDIFIDDWNAHREYFKRKGIRANFFVCSLDSYTDEQWQKLVDLKNDGHAIAFHGYDHLRAGTETEYTIDAFIEKEIMRGILKMNAYGLTPRHYSYPWGNRSNLSDYRLLKIFKTLKVGGGGVYLPPLPRIYGALNFGKGKGIPHVGALNAAIDGIVCLYMHKVMVERLDFLAEFASRNGIEFKTLDDMEGNIK